MENMENRESKMIVCVGCEKTFLFTPQEMDFYAEKGLTHEPKRCPDCRKTKRDANRQLFDAVCAECGAECKVPFEPVQDRPVYCVDCYRSHRN